MSASRVPGIRPLRYMHGCSTSRCAHIQPLAVAAPQHRNSGERCSRRLPRDRRVRSPARPAESLLWPQLFKDTLNPSHSFVVRNTRPRIGQRNFRLGPEPLCRKRRPLPRSRTPRRWARACSWPHHNRSRPRHRARVSSTSDPIMPPAEPNPRQTAALPSGWRSPSPPPA